MLLRACFCLLLAAPGAAIAGRDVNYSAPNSGACTDSATVSAQVAAGARKNPAAAPAASTSSPARDAKPRASVQGDGPARPSVRWHSFLPGMFR